MKVKGIALFLVALAGAVSAAEWRTFENADQTKSFVGRLVGYDPAKKLVTVQKKKTLRAVTFKVDLLSEENRDFVEERAMQLEAAGGLRMMFYESVEKTASTRNAGSRTSSYNGGFKIEIRNYLRRPIQDVEVDYLVIYRKDSTQGKGSLAVKKGTSRFTALLPSLDQSILVDGIPLTSYYKAGTVSVVGGST